MTADLIHLADARDAAVMERLVALADQGPDPDPQIASLQARADDAAGRDDFDGAAQIADLIDALRRPDPEPEA